MQNSGSRCRRSSSHASSTGWANSCSKGRTRRGAGLRAEPVHAGADRAVLRLLHRVCDRLAGVALEAAQKLRHTRAMRYLNLAAALALALPLIVPSTSVADAPMVRKQAPGYYRAMV